MRINELILLAVALTLAIGLIYGFYYLYTNECLEYETQHVRYIRGVGWIETQPHLADKIDEVCVRWGRK